ncbi:anti-sigma factor [Micromonospora sp. BRA006-A]|uniref:anti-sigma factor n=1 Tax=Micromonospora sp. BRA006-A TaxID=2962860 RepID=UPI00296E76B9|nr:anti-sigma factor [Micromonospora sp. BRA006-A]MDW3845671.1 anti-sigma factor [Micromonospora sp. BRA006-A]
MTHDGDGDGAQPGRLPEGADFDPLESGGIAAILRREAVWAAVPPDLATRILADVGAAAAQPGARTSDQPTPMRRGQARRSVPALRRHRFALAAAAAAVVGVGGALAVTVAQTDAPPTEVALVGTDLAQQSRGEARVEDTPSGVKISIDVSGLPPAAAGTYYEGWVSGDRGSVAIGTFHLRKGSDGVVLWSGVDMRAYPTIKVTLQQEGRGPASSGQVLLAGSLAG